MKKLFIIITILVSTLASTSEKQPLKESTGGFRKTETQRDLAAKACADQWFLDRLKQRHSNNKCTELLKQCAHNKMYANDPLVQKDSDNHIDAVFLPFGEAVISKIEAMSAEDKEEAIGFLEGKIQYYDLRSEKIEKVPKW